MPAKSNFITLKATTHQFHLPKAELRPAHLPKVRCSHICNDFFSSVDPVFWPAVEALKKSKAVCAEVISGRRRVKPSKKAKRAAGINTSDEAESDSELDDKANTGSKRKAAKNKDNSSKKKLKEAPKKNQARKKNRVDSDDAESTDENEGDAGDQADAYERLRLERETDRPVCARINRAYNSLLTNTIRSKEVIVLVVMIHAPPMFAPL
jgi:hypothetical protein